MTTQNKHVVTQLVRKRAEFKITASPQANGGFGFNVVVGNDGDGGSGDGCVRVVSVDKEVTGKAARLKTGDIVMSVNDETLTKSDSDSNVMMEKLEGMLTGVEALELVVVRELTQPAASAASSSKTSSLSSRPSSSSSSSSSCSPPLSFSASRKTSLSRSLSTTAAPFSSMSTRGRAVVGDGVVDNKLKERQLKEIESQDSVAASAAARRDSGSSSGRRTPHLRSSATMTQIEIGKDVSGVRSNAITATSKSGAVSTPSRGFRNWKTAARLYKAYRMFSKHGRYPWVQLSGHDGGFKETDSDEYILKMCAPMEREALEAAARMGLSGCIPECAGTKEENGVKYVKMRNLLSGFYDPNIMDCKIGLRTFLETELSPKPRMDLLKKLDAVDPTLATPLEREQGVTKLRYMQCREAVSSSSSLGFRIEAMRYNGLSDKSLKAVRAWDEVKKKILTFTLGRQDVLRRFIEELIRIREALCASEFFPCHEIIGSSILFVYDRRLSHAQATMIDFGKTMRRDVTIHHDRVWMPGHGSYEDGYLIGLNNIIAILNDCLVLPEGSPPKRTVKTAIV
eukprot:UC1_evm1s1915